MFKITQNTVRHFRFAEILLMAAINQFDKRQVGSAPLKQAEKVK